MRRPPFSLLLILLILSLPGLVSAGYVIHLRSGATFKTPQYWEEAGQIKFYRYGGVVGIPKESVEAIRKEDSSIEEKPALEQGPREEVSPAVPTEGKERPREPMPQLQETGQKEKEKAPLKAKAEIMAQYEKASARFNEAVTKRDKLGKREAQEEMKALHQRLSDLTQEVKNQNEGVLPPWWFEESSPEKKRAQEAPSSRAEFEEDPKEKKRALNLELKEALAAYARAKEGKDKEHIATEYQKASKLAAALERLRKEVLEKNEGTLPPWWDEAEGRP